MICIAPFGCKKSCTHRLPPPTLMRLLRSRSREPPNNAFIRCSLSMRLSCTLASTTSFGQHSFPRAIVGAASRRQLDRAGHLIWRGAACDDGADPGSDQNEVADAARADGANMGAGGQARSAGSSVAWSLAASDRRRQLTERARRPVLRSRRALTAAAHQRHEATLPPWAETVLPSAVTGAERRRHAQTTLRSGKAETAAACRRHETKAAERATAATAAAR
jgi:hypothetical protein